MKSSRSVSRCFLLVAIFLLSGLLVGCQAASATEVAPAVLLPTETPAPTRTPLILPPTNTPTPKAAAAVPTRTPSPSPTATFNLPQTMSAKATADSSIKCNKHADTWEVKVAPSWKAGWCDLESLGGYYYEYMLRYPSQWTVITFGDVYPSMAFSTDQKGVEVRLYQLYNYNIRKYEGVLEDAPLKAGFCDESDKCTPVVAAQEKIENNAVRNIGGKEVLVLDTVIDNTSGKKHIRRYFFYVPFKYARPASNRLFFIKLYTPEPAANADYAELEKLIADMIVSVKQDF